MLNRPPLYLSFKGHLVDLAGRHSRIPVDVPGTPQDNWHVYDRLLW
jgi:hypothetical protein